MQADRKRITEPAVSTPERQLERVINEQPPLASERR